MTDARKTKSVHIATDDSQAQENPSAEDGSAGAEEAAAPAKEAEPGQSVERQDRLDQLKEEIERARHEAQSNYDRLLRATAEFENYKKRAARETADFKKFANENLLRALLPVVDSLELAIASSSQDEKANSQVVQGVTLTLTELTRVLEGFGVTAVEAKGKPFDPNFHQAFMQETADDLPENTVIKEFQKGYLLHDRLIRPSMVIVSKKSSAADGAQSQSPEKPDA